MEITLLWTVFDVVGTIAFAVSGTLVGMKKRMDMFGVSVLSLVTAVGGGITRDILVGTVPLALRDGRNILLALGTTFVIAFLIKYRKNRTGRFFQNWTLKSYVIADTLGLAAFTATGASIGYHSFVNSPTLIVTMAIITAAGGGVIRDVLAQEIPLILRSDVYATASLIGGLAYVWAVSCTDTTTASNVCFIMTLVVRALAILYQWNLPRFK